MKRFRLILGGLILCMALTAATCNPNQQRTAYLTVYTAEQAATSAYSAYLDLVLKDQIPTNNLPSVSQKFNAFQAVASAATDSLTFNPTNPPPPDVSAKLTDLLTTIDVSKKAAKK